MEDRQGRSSSLGQGLLLFLATRPPRLPPAAFASFWLSRSTDSEKITLPWQETTLLATRDGQIWRVVWSRIWLGLPAALPPLLSHKFLVRKGPVHACLGGDFRAAFLRTRISSNGPEPPAQPDSTPLNPKSQLAVLKGLPSPRTGLPSTERG